MGTEHGAPRAARGHSADRQRARHVRVENAGALRRANPCDVEPAGWRAAPGPDQMPDTRALWARGLVVTRAQASRYGRTHSRQRARRHPELRTHVDARAAGSGERSVAHLAARSDSV